MTGLADAYDDLVAAMETGDIADELHTNLEDPRRRGGPPLHPGRLSNA